MVHDNVSVWFVILDIFSLSHRHFEDSGSETFIFDGERCTVFTVPIIKQVVHVNSGGTALWIAYVATAMGYGDVVKVA